MTLLGCWENQLQPVLQNPVIRNLQIVCPGEKHWSEYLPLIVSNSVDVSSDIIVTFFITISKRYEKRYTVWNKPQQHRFWLQTTLNLSYVTSSFSKSKRHYVSSSELESWEIWPVKYSLSNLTKVQIDPMKERQKGSDLVCQYKVATWWIVLQPSRSDDGII